MVGVVPLWPLAALVVAQPFQLKGTLEAETRGGRLSTGNDHGIGAEFTLQPTLVGTYAVEKLKLEATYGPRLFTRARGLGPERILILHNASVVGNMAVSRRLRVEVNLSGADGQVDFAGADNILDVDDATADVLPDQPIIEYTTGRVRLGVEWLPARLWLLESQLSATFFVSEQNTSGGMSLQNQRRFLWSNALGRRVDLDTIWGGELEFAYRSFEADPIFAGVTVSGTLEERLGPATTVNAWLGGHGSVHSEGGVWSEELSALPVGGIAAGHSFALPPNRRLGFDGHAELQPYHDPVLSTLDERFVLGLNLSLVLSSDLTVSAGAGWSGLVHLLTVARSGQTEHIVDTNARFSYRASSPFGVDVGIRYALRLGRRTSGGLAAGREELVAFLILTLSAELLGD